MEDREYIRIARQYLDTVYRVALSSCKNPQDAEDIVQCTFLKLLESNREFRDEEHIRKWLISSNIISYAATGRAWIITITTSDGKELLTAPGTYELEDGTEYTVKYELEETKASVTVEEEADSTKAEGAKTEGIEVEMSTENPVDLLEQPQK